MQQPGEGVKIEEIGNSTTEVLVCRTITFLVVSFYFSCRALLRDYELDREIANVLNFNSFTSLLLCSMISG